MATGLKLDTVERLQAANLAHVLSLVERSRQTDGVAPLSDHVLLHLLHTANADQRHVLVSAGDRLVGYGNLDLTTPLEGAKAELVIDPDFRESSVGALVLDALAGCSAEPIQLWSHSSDSAVEELARSRGFRHLRRLVRMRRSLSVEIPKATLPRGTTIRRFDQSIDIEAWLRLNASAFAELPDQGNWRRDDLEARIEADWFDPDGFILAFDAKGVLTGSHWTKIHKVGRAGPPAKDGTPAKRLRIGEVYVLAVDPSSQGHGLGRALTVIGLKYLESLGLEEVMLYVDADNAAAIRTYTSLDFEAFETDTLYISDGPHRTGPTSGRL